MSADARAFEIRTTPLAGLMLLHSRINVDNRGSFSRLFCQRELSSFLESATPVQANVSLTRKRGTVRGLHYQTAPYAETKIVRCVSGAVFDVAVDLRPDSATYGRWHGVTLTPENGLSLLIPAGFAHGFQAQADESILIYLHTEYFTPAAEAGVHCDDPAIAIQWPLSTRNLSPRDAALPVLDAN